MPWRLHQLSDDVPEETLDEEEARPPVRAPPTTKRPKPASAQSIRERIAPKKRQAGTQTASARPDPSLPGTAFLPKRNLPAPRGRFTTVDPSRASFESLFRPEGKNTLEALLEQVPHRVGLLRALETGYVGRRGQALSVGEVEDLLEAHELFEAMEKKEKAGILGALIEQQGALGRAAYHFGLSRAQLEQLVTALRITREVKEIRERFAKQALSPENVSLRLELLFRSRYLDDLGIEAAFEQSLKRQLETLIDEVSDAALSLPTLVDLLSRQHALHAESLRRAIEKLKLLES